MNLKFLLFLLFLGSAMPGVQATVIYVNQYSAGDDSGSSWANAYSDLQQALNAARAGDEIWVAGGDYKPTDTDDRYATFHIPTGVALYGGFAGSEANLQDRDWTSFPTFLNGDIGIPGDHRDNSYTVVTMTDPNADTILDGFEVRNGAANDQDIATPAYDPARIGGGLLILTSENDADYQANILNTQFFNNYAELGGAVYGDARFRSNIGVTFTNCSFELNQAGNGSAYMTSLGNTGPEGVHFINCTFFNNSSINQGLIYILTDTDQAGRITIKDCAFLENERDAIYVKGVGVNHPLRVEVSGTSFRGNISDNNGFDLLRFNSKVLNLKLDSLNFRGNEGYGRFISLGEADSVQMLRSVFVGNQGLTLTEGRPRFYLAQDCRISQNVLFGDVIRMEGIQTTVQDCILKENLCGNLIKLNELKSGGTHYPEGAYSVLRQTILYYNSAATLLEMGGDSLLVDRVQVSDLDHIEAGEVNLSARRGRVVNSLFTRPAVMENKKALLNKFPDSQLDFTNCTFYNFIDSEHGTVLFREQPREDGDTVQIRFHNSILWDELESAHPLFRLQNARVAISHSLLRAGNCDTLYRAEPTNSGALLPAAVDCGVGNLFGVNPQFAAIEQEDFTLSICSPAINAGSDDLLPVPFGMDLAGQARRMSTAVDLGSYEYQGAVPVLEVEAEIVAASGVDEADGRINLTNPGGGSPEYTYQWDTGATTASLEDLLPGEYSLTLTDGFGCMETFVYTVDFASTLVDPVSEWGVRLFPNPIRKGETVRLQWPDSRVDIRRLRLLGTRGDLIWETTNPSAATLPGLPDSGLYLLEMTDGTGRRGYLKWIVQ